MNASKISVIAFATLLPLGSVAASATAADADAANQSKVTAVVSDKTPKSGKKFNVSGTFTVKGKPAVNHVIRVQVKVNGDWKRLKGAKEDTNHLGAYKLNLILNSTGQQRLRVVGFGEGNESNAFQKFVVTVH